eukprot:scaffold335_cov68-Phaeocystis_antarctica.AAC.1
MHLVPTEGGRGHGLKGARANVQRDETRRDAARHERREHVRSEVEAGGGRGHAARLRGGGVDRLVVAHVRGQRGALQVRRQRRLAQQLQQTAQRQPLRLDQPVHLLGRRSSRRGG